MDQYVAIVFSTYNSAYYVGKCLDSCFSQDYPYIYVLVADDGSNDETLSILEDYKAVHPNFKYFALPHGERGLARKTAIEEARALGSDFLYILDSDMVLKEHLVRDCVDYLNEKKELGALVIPELAFSNATNYYSKVKVFERNIINNAGQDLGKNSIEAARFWRHEEYEKTGGINIAQISFEETQPTIRYLEMGGLIKRGVFTGVLHDEKEVTLKNIIEKKKYYFSQMNTTLESEHNGNRKAFSRWYFFRPVLYRRQNLLQYFKHPILTSGMVYMYLSLTFVGVVEILKSKVFSS